MKRILIFAGTTEGRELSAILAKEKIEHTVCVATEYGSMLTEQNEYAKVLCGRMDEEKMREVFDEEKTELIVDATHPYAYEVSRNIKNAIEGSDIEYIRLIRDMGKSLENSHIRHFENIESCIAELRKIEGNILLTTGSRELSAFASEKRILDRLFVRVIPSSESLAVCNENGIKGKNIIAMQGPFTTLMNEAVIDMYDIACVVSKQSGINGGFFEKAEAALNKNIPLFVIGLKEKEEGLSLEETVRKLTGNSLCESEIINDESANEKVETDGKSCFESAEITGNSDGKNKEEKSVKNIKDNLKINLVGVGMGQRNGLTLEALEAIENADTLIGAQRLLDIFNDMEIDKYPYYLAKDIVPLTEELFASKNKKNIAVLFSGDSNFYSGATLLYDALKNAKAEGKTDYEINIFPGISSVSCLAARLGKSYSDAKIISMHGKKINNIASMIKSESKIFVLLSGLNDIKELCEKINKAELEEVTLTFGYRLSYEDEKIFEIKPAEYENIKDEGLYVCLIENHAALKKGLTHGLKDEEFLRNSTPMTKEEVREVSICKLKLTKDSVLWDIGSGTGSIAIESALLDESVKVYAIERKDEALEQIRKNAEKFGVENVTVIEGEAPDVLDNLEAPSHAFIGGSGGQLKSIVSKLYSANPNVRVVINAVTMETFCEIKEVEESFSLKNFEIVQMQVSRSSRAGNYNLMKAENPVWICSFEFE